MWKRESYMPILDCFGMPHSYYNMIPQQTKNGETTENNETHTECLKKPCCVFI